VRRAPSPCSSKSGETLKTRCVPSLMLPFRSTHSWPGSDAASRFSAAPQAHRLGGRALRESTYAARECATRDHPTRGRWQSAVSACEGECMRQGDKGDVTDGCPAWAGRPRRAQRAPSKVAWKASSAAASASSSGRSCSGVSCAGARSTRADSRAHRVRAAEAGPPAQALPSAAGVVGRLLRWDIQVQGAVGARAPLTAMP
jgi:hypothetical protein